MEPVRIEQGLIAGKQEGSLHSFLGLPYAAPPVDELRWAPPTAPAPWEGVRDATHFGNIAIQAINAGVDMGAEQSEDCLYLNVYTITLDPEARRPVVFWIHGGGFLIGSSSQDWYPGGPLAQRDITLVTLNYRLGAFGFLAHPQISPNLGVQDWVAALEWVKRNITNFGGDPGNITISGQSAGGAATRALLHTPSARGLFHRAIVMSAGFEDYAAVDSPSNRRSTQATENAFRHLGTSDIEELRKAPADKVAAASLKESGQFPPPGQVHTPANLVWYPAPDGEIVTEDFSGWAEGVEVMFGVTRDESRMFHAPGGVFPPRNVDPAEVYTPETLAHMARRLGGERADDIIAHFTERGLAPYEALVELSTAAIWHEPALATYRRFAALDRTTYFYDFARHSPGSIETGLLAKHSAEIPYLFGTVTVGDFYNSVDVDVSDTIQHAWTEFARTGIPSSPDGTPWPACDSTAPQFTLIDDLTTAKPLDLIATPLCDMISSQRGE